MGYYESLFDMPGARSRFLELHENASREKNYWHVVPSWGHITVAIQVLYEFHPYWNFNIADEGRLWSLEQGVFISWVSAWKDILFILEDDHPAKNTEYHLISRQLLVEGAIDAGPRSGRESLWLVLPSNSLLMLDRLPKYSHNYMIKIRSPELLFDEIPAPIEANVKMS